MSNKKSSNKNYKNKSQDKSVLKKKFKFTPKYFIFILTLITSALLINFFVNQPVNYDASEITFDKDDELMKMEKEFFKVAKKSISSDEEYFYRDMSLIEKDVILATNVGKLISENDSINNGYPLKLNKLGIIKGYKVFSIFNISLTGTFDGPKGSLPFHNSNSNETITHTLPIAYVKGHIIGYTQDVYKKNSDEYLRTEIIYGALPMEAFVKAHNVHASDSFKIENIDGTNYSIYKNYNDFKTSLNEDIL